MSIFSHYCLPVDFILLVCIFFLRQLAHKLHKSVALVPPHSKSREVDMDPNRISVLFRLGVKVLDPVVSSVCEDRHDWTDEIRKCDIS